MTNEPMKISIQNVSINFGILEKTAAVLLILSLLKFLLFK
jgi:hypothetical protein